MEGLPLRPPPSTDLKSLRAFVVVIAAVAVDDVDVASLEWVSLWCPWIECAIELRVVAVTVFAVDDVAVTVAHASAMQYHPRRPN